MSSIENLSAEAEHQHHDYVGNAIPWYVRAIWIGFWIFAVAYTVRFLFPAMQIELQYPPGMGKEHQVQPAAENTASEPEK